MLPLPHLFNVNLPLIWYVGLPLATWAAYLSDHLADNTKNNNSSLTPRHQFIRTYKKNIIILIGCIAMVLLSLLISHFDVAVVTGGIIMSSFCLVYLFITSRKNIMLRWLYNKELFVAFIYSTALYIVIGLHQPDYKSWLPYYFIFLLIVYLNLLMVSIIELEEDRKNGQFSWTVVIGENRAKAFLYILVSGILVLIAVTAIIGNKDLIPLLMAYGLMTILHVIIFRNNDKLKANRLYRKLSEMIFWLPVLLCLLD